VAKEVPLILLFISDPASLCTAQTILYMNRFYLARLTQVSSMDYWLPIYG
jgi:hypothetical protein